MAGRNADVSAIFDRIADLLEIQQANPFRIRAYRNAARTVAGLGQEVSAMLDQGADLAELPGIGEDLAGKISEIARTGELGFLKKLEREVPPGLPELLSVPGLGPKRVRLLHDRLKIKDIGGLRRAVAAGKLEAVAGLGAKTAAKIAAALAAPAARNARTLRAAAEETARRLMEHIRGADGLVQATVAGSFRRRAETVGDLDVLASAPKAAPVIARFVSFPGVARVAARGTTRAAVVLSSGLQVDLRVVPAESYGAALHYFTGSKAHNVALRAEAAKRGLKINEYGVFRGKNRIAGRTEAEVYAAMKLPYIEPELRENRGELEAARKGRLPKLIAFDGLKGDLHVHTSASDGTATVRQMAVAARELGLSYIAITDHTRSLRVAHGLDPRRLKRQWAEIDRVNAELRGMTVLKSAEVDILPDGSLDLPDGTLAELDFAVCAVHSSFGLSRARQTERIIRAMDHPACSILAHPSGRLIGDRPALDVDMDRLLLAAKERGVAMELNAQPERLDLSDVHCRRAKELGVKIVISSDGHGPGQFRFLAYGVAQGRRGWLEAGDVVNTKPWAQARKLLRRS